MAAGASMERKWQYPHRRWNPLRQSWVLVSPHRTQRPWQGEVGQKTAPSADSLRSGVLSVPGQQACGRGGESRVRFRLHLCKRLRGAAARCAQRDNDASASPLLVAEPARGLCKVLCFHPDHSLTLARMTRRRFAASSTHGRANTRNWAPSTGSSTCRSSRTAAR